MYIDVYVCYSCYCVACSCCNKERVRRKRETAINQFLAHTEHFWLARSARRSQLTELIQVVKKTKLGLPVIPLTHSCGR